MSQGNDLISRDKAIELVTRICNDILTSCKSHYDEELGEEVYDDIKEFNAVLKCNKDIRTALRELPAERKWTPISEGLPEERINENTGDFEYVLCSTPFGDVRAYKFGTGIGRNVPRFFDGLGGTMDDRVVAWMYLPDAYVPVEETVEETVDPVEERAETVEETDVLLGDAVEKLDKAIAEYNAAMTKSLTKWCNKITAELLKAKKKLEEGDSDE